MIATLETKHRKTVRKRKNSFVELLIKDTHDRSSSHSKYDFAILMNGLTFFNNSVGVYTGDPSVAGSMTAYQDGMTKLLWPELRPGIRSVKVITEDSKLPDLFPMLKEQLPEFADLPDLELGLLRVPKGTPINLLMNVHPKDIKSVLQAYVDGVLQGEPRTRFAELRTKNHDAALQRMMDKLLEVNMCPDFVEDRGHTYGHELSDQDKQALIEYMKYF
jgi:hypothetical protein